MSFDFYKNLYLQHNCVFFEKGDYNLNIFGIREKERRAGKYDDTIGVCYYVGGKPVFHCWPATTDPGLYYLENPINLEGCAILAPGQYRSAYKLGLHKNKYPALVQARPVGVYRDSSRDSRLDPIGRVTSGFFGINIHQPFGKSDEIGLSSAGCQVFSRKADLDELLKLCENAARIFGNVFTYTLFS